MYSVAAVFRGRGERERVVIMMLIKARSVHTDGAAPFAKKSFEARDVGGAERGDLPSSIPQEIYFGCS